MSQSNKMKKMKSVAPTGIHEGGEEVTRRAAGSSFAPSLEPISFSPHQQNLATLSAGPIKASMAPAASVAPAAHEGFVWNLEDVPTLPKNHPLERTTVFVPNCPCSKVSQRISKVLRERSIEAQYEDDKGKVRCLSPDNVDFRVRLYRGRDKYNHGIIVEVQRRYGGSLNFHNDTWAILDSARGKTPAAPTVVSPPLVSDIEDDCPPPTALGVSSLVTVAKILSFPGQDSYLLALQTLMSMTDANKMGANVARAVSKDLLDDDNVVGSKVVSLVVDKTYADDIFMIRRMALTVLANAIKNVRGNGISAITREQLRPVLLNALDKAEQNPRSAQMAAQCLEFLIDGDHNAADLYSSLEKALLVGTARHMGLMRQVETCLAKIQ